MYDKLGTSALDERGIAWQQKREWRERYRGKRSPRKRQQRRKTGQAEVEEKNAENETKKPKGIEIKRRIENPGKALNELYTGFNDWSSIVTNRSIEASFALIAANWAVHGSADNILHNFWAKSSLITIIVFLGANLVGTSWVTRSLQEAD